MQIKIQNMCIIVVCKTVISTHRDSVGMADLNPNCNCPKTECPRHGNCMACVEAHKSEGKNIPFCLRFLVKTE